MRSTDCGCGDTAHGAHDGLHSGLPDVRQWEAIEAFSDGYPVLGPTLGGGFSGSGIGSGVGRVGGGNDSPVLWAAHAAPFDYPEVRVDFHYDYSTPRHIFERDPRDPTDRQLGGME